MARGLLLLCFVAPTAYHDPVYNNELELDFVVIGHPLGCVCRLGVFLVC